MKPKTQQLWQKQDRHQGDRWRLFQAIRDIVPAESVLYAGCYVDIAPSFVYPNVTYIDMDNRAAQFFADTEGVRQIIREHRGDANSRFTFLHGDYRSVSLDEERYDLLISLYAGFISEACGHCLRIGGKLLVNSSHGDAALAAMDSRFELAAVVLHRGNAYSVTDKNLERYRVPKKAQTITRERIKASGRGIAYTKPAFAYLFRRVG